MLIHLCSEYGLPWNVDLGMEHVKIQKEIMDEEEICQDIPEEFGEFLKHARHLKFK